MNVVGIIAEYNPFHNGHLYHLQESVKRTAADYTICVMSGNFTQRGEPAMADKWTRAEAAVRCGIDLVLELPFPYACNHAGHFAKGAVSILNGLGCVTHLSFGSEGGDLDALNLAAIHLLDQEEDVFLQIREQVSLGHSFPRARFEALRRIIGEEKADLFRHPNSILGIEYLKHLKLSNSQIQPITIKRLGTGYHDLHAVRKAENTEEMLASATAIRAMQKSNADISSYIPKAVKHTMQEKNLITWTCLEDFYPLILYQILKSDIESLRSIYSVTEGLEYKIIKATQRCNSAESLIKALKSKRYTQTRIQRMLIHLIVNLNREAFQQINQEDSSYARVIAFSEKGAQLLAQIKKRESATIPVLTNINRQVTPGSQIEKMLRFDVMASNLYNLIRNGALYENSDYVKKPVMIKDS